MAKAKIIPDEQLERLLDEIASGSVSPERDFVIVLLSCKAGLRAQEIAGLTWRDVTDVAGNITNEIHVPSGIAKKGHERVIPMHPRVREALELLREVYNHKRIGGRTVATLPIEPRGRAPLVLGAKTGEAMSPNNMAKWLSGLYHRHGLDASSHSGRRTVITKLARMANDHGCSLFDVQKVAGHRHISSTEAYVVHSDNVHAMISKL